MVDSVVEVQVGVGQGGLGPLHNQAASKEYIALLEESLMTLDENEAFITSPDGEKVFGDKRDGNSTTLELQLLEMVIAVSCVCV